KWLNKMGAEWKTRVQIGDERGIFTELYQPLTLNGELFVALGGSVDSGHINLYQQEVKVLSARRTRRTIHLDIGSAWGRWGEVRVGLERSKSNLSVVSAVEEIANELASDRSSLKGTDDHGGVRFALGYDQLDSARYSRMGTFARLELYRSMRVMGAKEEFHSASLDLKQAFTKGKWSLLVNLNGSTISNNEKFDLFDLKPSVGGLFNLSSYAKDEFRGQKILRTQIRLSRDIMRLSPVWGKAAFGGVSLESAKIWDVHSSFEKPAENKVHHSIAVFIGSDTRIGPAYLAIGYGDNKKARVYLSINGGF
ncbi:hypothetical protein, partial [Chitinimonas sp. BJB300]